MRPSAANASIRQFAGFISAQAHPAGSLTPLGPAVLTGAAQLTPH